MSDIQEENPFVKMFSSFQGEAFRVESLGKYHIDDSGEFADFQNYLNGGIAPDLKVNKDWYDSIQNWVSTGKKILRLRVLPAEWTQYLDYEIDWCYPRNISAGEDIRLISEPDFVTLFGAPPQDFWLFDGVNVLLMKYADDGKFLGGELLPEAADYHLKIREAGMKSGVGLGEYLKGLRQTPGHMKK